ncbi:transmembrane protein 87A-like isoform X2 [Panonychus citri]|uniref:transmembrane protein 87A-like isoform X2 n=1 Tax=Panonychus citri TaxID=50023 RepID=UPI0023082DE2|nr:transmembrane protein 87A-like isoform X2 [Panonychus citri]
MDILKLSFIQSILFLVYLDQVSTFPDPGKWSFSVNKQKCHYFNVHKVLYKDSKVSVKVHCDPGPGSSKDMKIKVGYVIRESPCFEEYVGPQLLSFDFIGYYYNCPYQLFADFGYNSINYLKTEEKVVTCDHLVDESLKIINGEFSTSSINNTGTCPSILCESSPSSTFFYRELTDDDNTFNAISKRSIDSPPLQQLKNDVKRSPSKIDGSITIPSDGVYLLIVYLSAVEPTDTFNAIVDLEMKGTNGYLSADEWPLLPFYGVMSIVYFLYAVGWLVASAMQWRDLLRIQFWIGGVLFLGMLEKAVFYAEYQSINSTGRSVKSAILLAELISCLKRTLARMLVIIVSLGFGIVKPRLGPMLHRVVCVGGLFFTMSALEAMLRVYRPKNDPTNQTLMAGIPLAVLDSIICWWIFSSLVQTMRTLRLRRNLVKLNSYRIFTNALIFAVLASIVFMIWVIHNHKFTKCITEWNQLWFDIAYWDVLFSIVLLVIMILWRPTNNNQRYAFTPLLDASDDEDDLSDQVVINEIFGVKMRQQSSGSSSNHQHKAKDAILSAEAEEDLKWIEENIPSSLVDAALPALIDSDEEIMSTKFERSKME